MTIPTERFRAVQAAREFLYELLDPKETPNVPKKIRQHALRVLRHYPLASDMTQAAELAPDVFQTTAQKHVSSMKRSTKKYDGYTPAENDIVINGYRLMCTCSACPEQYDVFIDDTGSLVGYLRLRHGTFRADCPDVGGETVYTANTKGDGTFDADERLPELTNAVAAIQAWWAELKKD